MAPDKTWFIYLKDRYQGPLTADEVRIELEQGRIDHDTFVWAESLPDWRPLRDVKALLSAPDPGLDWVETDYHSPSPFEVRDPLAEWSRKHPGKISFKLNASSTTATAKVTARHGESKRWMYSTLGALALTLAGAVAWNFKSKLPEFTNIEPGDRQALNAAARAPELGRAALAVARLGSEAWVYVASNLPATTRVDVRIHGRPETLLGQFQLESHAEVTLKDGWAQTPSLKNADGSAYPPGEYEISLACLSCATIPRELTLAQKSVRLGEVNPAALELYHAKLREQSAAELVELNQFSAMLGQQLAETEAKFQARLSKAAWSRFDQRWTSLQTQLNLNTQGWVTETFTARFYHGGLFRLLKDTTDLVSRIHAEQNSGPTGSQVDRLASETALARSSLLAIQSKVLVLERAGPDRFGMPAKTSQD